MGDGRELFRQSLSAASPGPTPLDVDLTGVRRLRILVDHGDDRSVADYVHLCNVRISK
jgi:hypothetical protein